MNPETFLADIPAALAESAYSGTSFTPEKRGVSSRNEYAQTMAEDYAGLVEIAKGNPDKLATLEAEFPRYRAGFSGAWRKYLASNARCVSWMIAGPSNFPARRMQKRADIAHKRLNEMLEFRKRALAAIKKAMFPELAPIMAGDSDACSRLAEKIAQAEALQAQMKAVNTVHKRFLKDPASLDTCGLPDEWKDKIRRYVPRYSWEPHPIAPFEFTNNSANIRRMKERLASISRNQALPDTAQESENGNGIRLEDCPAENRVRLFFPGKPEAEVRTRLKSSGFRWSPTIGCWQAYRNAHSMAVAKEFVQ